MLILLIFNGTQPAQPHIIAPDTTLITQAPLPWGAVNLVGMLPMAHVFERLWFAVFDAHHYSPHQADYDDRPPAVGAGAGAPALNESAL